MTEPVEYFEHITTEGERWDQIAQEFYGDPLKYEPIMDANPHVPISSTLEGGLVMQVPKLPEENRLPDAHLPIWKRKKP